LPAIRQSSSLPEVIIMTGAGDPDGAELAIKSGAWDYIEKSFYSAEEMTLPLTRAIQYRQEKGARSPKVLKRTGIVGDSPANLACLNLVSLAASSETNVLIVGETGTGKELFARAIHENSHRAAKSIVVVDCTALPETLVESLLFGHCKGAFTSAEFDQDGLIKQADGGTLFLDEIGELPLHVQKSFLRVLQEHRFRPVGSNKEVEADFRLVAATNRNLDRLVQERLFREDLLFRLRSFTIELSPLREHTEDIHAIAIYHMDRLCQRYGIGTKGMSPDFFEVLKAYEWPGNVRELVNALERALAAAWNEPTLFPQHLPPEIRIKLARQAVSHPQNLEYITGEIPAAPAGAFPSWRDTKDSALAKVEKNYLKDLMAHVHGNINRAIQISGLKRSRLYQLLKKHGIGSRG